MKYFTHTKFFQKDYQKMRPYEETVMKIDNETFVFQTQIQTTPSRSPSLSPVFNTLIPRTPSRSPSLSLDFNSNGNDDKCEAILPSSPSSDDNDSILNSLSKILPSSPSSEDNDSILNSLSVISAESLRKLLPSSPSSDDNDSILKNLSLSPIMDMQPAAYNSNIKFKTKSLSLSLSPIMDMEPPHFNQSTVSIKRESKSRETTPSTMKIESKSRLTTPSTIKLESKSRLTSPLSIKLESKSNDYNTNIKLQTKSSLISPLSSKCLKKQYVKRCKKGKMFNYQKQKRAQWINKKKKLWECSNKKKQVSWWAVHYAGNRLKNTEK